MQFAGPIPTVSLINLFLICTARQLRGRREPLTPRRLIDPLLHRGPTHVNICRNAGILEVSRDITLRTREICHRSTPSTWIWPLGKQISRQPRAIELPQTNAFGAPFQRHERPATDAEVLANGCRWAVNAASLIVIGGVVAVRLNDGASLEASNGHVASRGGM